ncbi:MAG: DUF1566 domain-containing protein [Bacteroides sp.]|nr:DUF1566 domain-containing protein [Bacteroides sp.]
MLFLASCSDYGQPQSAPGQEENTYSFTAVLPGIGTRMSYQEDPDTRNLKMVWDETDVIWLYPDESMGDPIERYEFVPNTGAGTSHTVFVHQGYIKNWEHWSGKAIYLFPEGDNFDVSHDSAEFLAKAQVQKKNGDTEHLKYAEHVLGPDGSKQYTEYWSQNLVDANLKHDHRMAFSHPHTVVYKVMLRGFIFDIPGGSQLRMSGDAWGDEVTTLTLGSKDDREPFVKVGEYGKDNYQDNVLTAYIIRQVAGDVDGKIGTDGKLKFELLTYDELDGTVMPLDPDDTMRNDNPDYGPDYLTNLPWGDEYTWNVTATKDIEYKAGDFVVADLTDKEKDYAYPKVAVDLGLPLKWAAFNLGAKKVDEYGEFVSWGRTTLFSEGGPNLDVIFDGEWTSGDPEHDAASFHWGDEWRTPTINEFLDLVHYAEWCDVNDNPAEDAEARWCSSSNLTTDHRIYYFEKDTNNPARKINNVSVTLVRSKANDKYIYLHIAGNLQNKGAKGSGKAYYNISSSNGGRPMMMGILQEGKYVGENRNRYYIGYTDNANGSVQQLAASVRAVKD